MISVYKFEECHAYKVRSSVLTLVGWQNTNMERSFSPTYYDREEKIVVPVPKHINTTLDEQSRVVLDINSMINPHEIELTYDKTLYVHSNCSIPRAKVTSKYKRTLKADKADICVVPKIGDSFSVNTVAIFYNKETKRVYYIEGDSQYNYKKGEYEYTEPKLINNYPIGTSILQINPHLKGSTIKESIHYGESSDFQTFSNKNWNSFLESSLIYYGPAILLHRKNVWVADFMYKKLHNIVFEDNILATLGDSSNVLNKESYDSIKQMLNSSDMTVVGLGLKALAEMDYEKYKNTAIHLLYTSSKRWRDSDIKNSTSVKYMLDFLNLRSYHRENYFKTTTQEDFDTLNEAIKSEISDALVECQNGFARRFPFINVDLEYQISITPKLKE